MSTRIKNKFYRLLLLPLLLLLVFNACQKEITIELPDAKQKICVEGKIEPGLPPYVILTHNVPYFGATDIAALQNTFVHNAVVKISNGTSIVTLMEYCSQNIPDSILPFVAQFTGVDTASLKNFNYCLYTTFSMLGSKNITYDLSINVEGKSLSSSAKILDPIPLDSTWFKYLKANKKGDSLGFVYAHLTDPPIEGNCYRWLTMRKGKDFSYVVPPGSVFDDKFINGKSFDFAYERGINPNSNEQQTNPEEVGFFKRGDTVIVKFCAIERPVFDFFRQEDIAIYSQGNPFASPTSVPSNVFPREDALGVWCGYGTAMDTVVFK